MALRDDEKRRDPGDGGPIVGIDLGTTNSLVAICDGEGPRLLPGPDGEVLMPSTVGYRAGGAVLVGRPARDAWAAHPLDTVISVKRLMGRARADVEEEAARASCPVVAGPRGMACVAPPARVGAEGGSITPQEVSAEILAALRVRAETALGRPVTRAVITVPAYFDDAQRQATRDAGRLAGLDVARIVNEPTAAALAYGIGVRSREAQTVAVYDLGGGTFDVTVLRVIPDEGDGDSGAGADIIRVLATAGDTHLGGDDFDDRLAMEILRRLRDQPGVMIGEPGPALRVVLRGAAEAAKIALSDAEWTMAKVPETAQTPAFETRFERAEFEALIGPLVERTIAACRRALRDAGVGVAEVDRVVLVGGASRTPLVRREVEACFGAPPYTALDPDTVVALGAAVQGAIMRGTGGPAGDILLLDVVPLSIGIETVGGAVAKLVLRNSAVPARARELFSTSVDGQTSVKIHVLQGERELVRDCRSLGEFHLRGIPPMPAGIPQVEVEFLVDVNGILSVSAVERRSGRRAAIQVVPAYGLSREEVDRMERESVLHARADMHAHRIIDLVVNAQLDVKWIGEALGRVRGHLEPSYVESLEARLAEVMRMIDAARRDPAGTSADELHAAKQALDEASLRLHEVSIARSLRGDATPGS